MPAGGHSLQGLLVILVLFSSLAAPAATAAAAPSPPREAATLQPDLSPPGTAAAAFTEGMLLALVPSLLPLLVVHLRAAHRRQRQELGTLSLVWPPVVGSFAGLLLALTLVQLLATSLGLGAPLSSPAVLAALALPQLFFALALWLVPDRLSALDRSDGHSAATALVAPILALPWIPLTPTVAAIASGVGTPVEAIMAASGFTLPALVTALAAAVLSRTEGQRRAWQPSALLGFLPLLALIWISYLLLETLPTHLLAFVQLGWLALSLTARLAQVSRARRRRWALAVLVTVVAAGTVWFAASGEPLL